MVDQASIVSGLQTPDGPYEGLKISEGLVWSGVPSGKLT